MEYTKLTATCKESWKQSKSNQFEMFSILQINFWHSLPSEFVFDSLDESIHENLLVYFPAPLITGNILAIANHKVKNIYFYFCADCLWFALVLLWRPGQMFSFTLMRL